MVVVEEAGIAGVRSKEEGEGQEEEGGRSMQEQDTLTRHETGVACVIAYGSR